MVGWQPPEPRLSRDHVDRGIEVAADLGRNLRLDQRYGGEAVGQQEDAHCAHLAKSVYIGFSACALR